MAEQDVRESSYQIARVERRKHEGIAGGPPPQVPKDPEPKKPGKLETGVEDSVE